MSSPPAYGDATHARHARRDTAVVDSLCSLLQYELAMTIMAAAGGLVTAGELLRMRAGRRIFLAMPRRRRCTDGRRQHTSLRYE